jgi:deoxyribodipyrimidine photo-lyase
LNDHAALSWATTSCERVYIVFIYDSVILDVLPSRHDRRLQFISSSLDEIHNQTQALLTAHGNPIGLVPAIAQELGVDVVVASHDDDPYALTRDHAIKTLLGPKFITVKDHIVKERQEVMKDDGTAYRVYTPYSRAWRQATSPAEIQPYPVDLSRIVAPKVLKHGRIGNHALDEIGFEPTDLVIPAGERAASQRLLSFVAKMPAYGTDRDFPAKEGTSDLSVDLRFGTISIRECFRVAAQAESPGARKFESELIWREFYQMILANFPEVGRGQTFQPALNDIKWPGDLDHLELWKAGRTGYPIVDAAMRELAETGRMHNRLRMVTAMFLTKDLLIDWRFGEQHFANLLLDFDLASNNGGWQWSASTGADAQPYFRVMNPILQSRKFDPEGQYIRRWVPELAAVDAPFIHWPFDDLGNPTLETPADYATPIVNHFVQRDQAIALFKTPAHPGMG